jgi:hypothetical protein
MVKKSSELCQPIGIQTGDEVQVQMIQVPYALPSTVLYHNARLDLIGEKFEFGIKLKQEYSKYEQ